MQSRNNTPKYFLLFCLLTPSFAINLSFNTREVLAQPININKQEGDQYYESGRQIMAAGSLFAAKPKFQQALKIYQEIDDRIGQYNCQIQLARIDYKEGKYQQARSKLRLANQVANYSTNDGQARTLEGLIALELGNYYEALSKLRVGVHELRVNSDNDRLSREELNETKIALGEVYGHQSLFKQAQLELSQVLNVVHNLHLRRRAFNALGSIQLEIGQYDQAFQSFNQAAGVANTVGDRIGKAKTLENLGKAYQIQGEKRQALKQYQLALNELRSIGAWNRQIYVLNNLGRLALDLGLSNRALEYLKSAEGSLSNSGGVGRVETYINLGYYYTKKKDYDLAIGYLEQGLNWASSNGDRIGEAKALRALGEIEMTQKNFKDAVKTLESSVAIFESLRPGLRDEQKISLSEVQKQTYDSLQQAYVAQNQPEQALVTAERGKARAFIELLAQRLLNQSGTEVDFAVPNLKQIKTVAKNRQATLVNYSIIEEQGEEAKLYIWVVNPQGEINFRQLDLRTIKKEFRTSVVNLANDAREAAAGGLDLRKPRLQDYVVSFRGDIQTDTLTSRKKLSFPRDAYKLLIEPVKDLLPVDPEELVVFVPQGSLFLVPFPALQNNEGEFLIEQHTIQISPSIQTLALKQPKSQGLNNSKALIVGNPEPMPQSLASLAGAETEAKAIADILNTTPILGQQATETSIVDKMQDANLIHLATHGLFDEHQGLQSSLAFSTSDNTEGLLTAAEILELKLTAELVVLSACNTGRGKITGDGVVGLSRSFLLAGAQNTLVSLWYVPDLATSTLMTDFYRQLQNDPNKPQALRKAILNTMQTYPSPREWGAFMLVGQ